MPDTERVTRGDIDRLRCQIFILAERRAEFLRKILLEPEERIAAATELKLLVETYVTLTDR